MKCIVGMKKEMTRLYVNGEMIPVTKISCEPNVITQVKTKERDGYSAIQVGYFVSRKTKKPRLGHTKGLSNFRRFKEFRVKSDKEGVFERGKTISCAVFEEGERIKVTGFTKGRGFQGVVKRHGFSGAKQSHGTKDQIRMPGSIGSQGPQHVFKGTRMAGRYGNEQMTIANLEVIKVDTDENVLYVRGAVPGHRNAYVFLTTKNGEMDFSKVEELLAKQTENTQNVKEEVKEVKTQDETKEDKKES